MGAGVAVGIVITSIAFVVVLVILRAIANFGSKKGKLSMNIYGHYKFVLLHSS